MSTTYHPNRSLIDTVRRNACRSSTTNRQLLYIDVPYVRATVDNLHGFATLLSIDNQSDDVIEVVPWPNYYNQRSVDGGTGGRIISERFGFTWSDNGECSVMIDDDDKVC
jgi:hypothetical protein